MTRLLAITTACLTLLAMAPAAVAQTSSTTSSSTSSTTSSTTSTTLPPEEAPDSAHEEEVAPEDVPDPVPVPPPPAPKPPSPVTQVVTKVVTTRLRKARVSLAEARRARQAAQSLIDAQTRHLDDLRARLDGLRVEEREAVARLKLAGERLRARAVQAYVYGGFGSAFQRTVRLADDDIDRREGYVSAIATNDRRILREYAAAKEALTSEIAELAGAVASAEVALEAARTSGSAAADIEAQKDTELKMLQAGGAIAIGGFVFPVGDPHTFGSSFGAPRMTGTSYEHWHQGNDIFAPAGTPLFACERGVIVRVGTDVLGGTKLWLSGQSGTRYYYAHLAGYAPGIAEGVLVEAGDLVGYVGDTGNARGTPPHLHFEIHPGGGPAIDPYPILKTVDDATRAVRRRGG